jgi:hypothetical protein
VSSAASMAIDTAETVTLTIAVSSSTRRHHRPDR